MQAMVSCVSEGTGNVSRALKKAGMWDTTLFLWSSDNGGPQYWLGNNFPLRGGKGKDLRDTLRCAHRLSNLCRHQHLLDADGQDNGTQIHRLPPRRYRF